MGVGRNVYVYFVTAEICKKSTDANYTDNENFCPGSVNDSVM